MCLEECYPEPLLAIASYGLAASTRELPRRPVSTEAWLTVLDSARNHRLLGLLCAAIENGSLPGTDEQVKQARQLHLSAWSGPCGWNKKCSPSSTCLPRLP